MNSVGERDIRVVTYLDVLETALRAVPERQATELMEQITAHLDEALPPGSSEEAVVAVLRRLGSPAKLAAEAQNTARLDEAVPQTDGSRRLRRPLRHRFSRRGWSAIAAGLVLLCVLTTLLGLYVTTPSLVLEGSSAWWDPQDEARAVDSSTLGAQATTVPARRGQWQGFVVQIENPSSSAQTVLGVGSNTSSPTALVGLNGITDVWVSMSTYSNDTGAVPDLHSQHFSARQTIQPGQFRFLRVMWLTDTCSLSSAPGLTGSDALDLTVQVGWFQHEEVLALDPGWQLQFDPGCPPL